MAIEVEGYLQFIYSERFRDGRQGKNFVITHDIGKMQDIIEPLISFREALGFAGYTDEELEDYINIPMINEATMSEEELDEYEMREDKSSYSSNSIPADDENLSSIAKPSSIPITEENIDKFLKALSEDKELAEKIFRRYSYDWE